MDITVFLSLTVVVFLAVIIFYGRNEERKRMLQKIPGAPSLPLIGTALPILYRRKEDRMTWIEEILEKYKPLILWYFGNRPFVNISSPELIEVVLRNTQLIDKAFLYDLFHSWLGTGLLTSSGAKWHQHRKIITPTFHFSILEGFITIFAEKSEILVRKLQKEVGRGPFFIRQYVSNCALDIICETAMGTSVNAQDEGFSEYVTAINKMTDVLSDRMANPLLYPEFIFKLTPYYWTHKKCLKVLNGFVNKIIQERKEERKKSKVTQTSEDADIGKKKRVPFLDTLLDASEDDNKLTDTDILEEVHTFMFEGHDTVSAAMTWLLFELGHHPEIQEEAYKEVQDIFQGSDRVPTMADLNNMNYLERVIKESLRLHPSVIYFVREAHQDFELGGYTIPAGTNIDFSVPFIHRNPEIFPNPRCFNPDNFLPDRVVNRHPYAYIPFSAGPRNCIGQRFALLEEKVVLSYLLRHYRFRTVNKREDSKFKLEMINTPVKPIQLIIEARN
uniref:Cytochrome P450 4c21 n=1 Tax=Blattella germanica TaxID=6973 RepID=CP4CU_BLAGE|nr:RecName: Full=Cytochrome P450 4c21; AltName: Full=CYPIVC21 [Blattella germanica]AAK69411.1 cytochrome P450 [Blattella germanica]